MSVKKSVLYCIQKKHVAGMHNGSNVNGFLLQKLEVKNVNGLELFIKNDDHNNMRLGTDNWAEIITEFKTPPVT